MNMVPHRNDICVCVRISVYHLSALSKQVFRMSNKSPYSLVSHTRYAYSRWTLLMTWGYLRARIIPYDIHVAEQTMK
jgi:hypothetical protein